MTVVTGQACAELTQAYSGQPLKKQGAAQRDRRKRALGQGQGAGRGAGAGRVFSGSCPHAGPEIHRPGSYYLAAPTHPILDSVALVILCCEKRKTKRNPMGVHTLRNPNTPPPKKAHNMVEKKQEKITDRGHGVVLVSRSWQQWSLL